MSETHRIKLAHGIANRLHPHALAIIVGLMVLMGGAVSALWINQGQVASRLESCKENFEAYKTLTERSLTAYASAAAESKKEVNALRYDFAESRDTLKALKQKFLTPAPH